MSFLGAHTVDELADWTKALDYQVGQIEAARASSTWQRTDPAGFAAWAIDWAAFRRRFDAARASAQSAIDGLSFLPGAVVGVEGKWTTLERALTQVPGKQTRGDFQELADRLNAGAKIRVTYADTPQPTAADFDLGVYKAADSAIRDAGLPPTFDALSRKVLIGGALALALVLVVRR